MFDIIFALLSAILFLIFLAIPFGVLFANLFALTIQLLFLNRGPFLRQETYISPMKKVGAL